MCGKYRQKFLDGAKKSGGKALSFVSKGADAVAKSHNHDKITKNTSKNTSSKSKTLMQTENTDKMSGEIYIPPEKRQQIIHEIRLM